jgi:hypothetical protein
MKRERQGGKKGGRREREQEKEEEREIEFSCTHIHRMGVLAVLS